VTEHLKSEQGLLDEAASIWNVALVLDDLEEYEKAEEWLKQAREGYEPWFGEKRRTINDEHGRTPLSWAAGNGYDAIVEEFLKNIVDLNLKDSQSGQTSLSWAAKNGHEGVVKRLLETSKVDVDSKDKFSRKSLSYATEYNNKGVVKLLL
jgi:ankyrin repeat protein